MTHDQTIAGWREELAELAEAERVPSSAIARAELLPLLLAALRPGSGDVLVGVLEDAVAELEALAELAKEAGQPIGGALASVERRLRVAGELRRRELAVKEAKAGNGAAAPADEVHPDG